MKLLSGIFAATLSSVVALAAANAADMYQPGPAAGGYKDGPAYVAVNWAGFYAGVNGGYGWSENSDQLANSVPFSGLSPEGGFGGGQIGYNWQGFWHPHLVLGIEADFQGGDIQDSATDVHNNHYSSQLDWFGTVRGRIGYAFDRALIYATGGFAYGNVDNKAISHLGPVFENNNTEAGYSVGGGVEYKLAPAWSVKAEYQYINLGTNDPVYDGVTYKTAAAPATVNDDAYHTFRVGVNYHFFQGFEPLK